MPNQNFPDQEKKQKCLQAKKKFQNEIVYQITLVQNKFLQS
jgi:hypothetical protein